MDETKENPEFPNNYPPRKKVPLVVRWWSNFFYGLEKIRFNRLGVNFDRESDGAPLSRDTVKTPKRVFIESMDALDIPRQEVNFMDVGCGKGYCLYLAHRLKLVKAEGGGKLGGVEIDQFYYNACRDNLRKLNVPTDNLFCCDAAELIGELDTYNVFWVFNPFPAEIMRCFAQHLRESLLRKKRKAYMVYCNPLEWQTVEEFGFIKKKVLHIPYNLYYMDVCFYTLP